MGCVISSWTFFLLVGGQVIGSQYHQTSGSSPSGIYVLVGSIQLTSFRLMKVSVSVKQLKGHGLECYL